MKKILNNFLEKKNYHNSVTNLKYLSKEFPELIKHIQPNKNFNYSGQLYCFINNKSYPICEKCNDPYNFISFKKGFRKNCKNKCKLDSIKYNGIFFKKKNNKILVCKKHNRYISIKVFNKLKNQGVEYFCEPCSLKIVSRGIYDEKIALKSKNILKKIFKNRKKFTKQEFKSYFPNFYLRVNDIKELNNFENKLNFYLYDYSLQCSSLNCNQKVSFDKTHLPKKYCEKCNRKNATEKFGIEFSRSYWKDYIKSYFYSDNILDIKVQDKNLIIKKYCKHSNELKISKQKIRLLKIRGIFSLCNDCNREFYYKNKVKIDIQDFKNAWNKIKTLPEEKILIYNPYIWAFIKDHMNKNNSSFAESKFMIRYDIKERPKCNCCDKKAIFSNEAYDYLYHCKDHLYSFNISSQEHEIKDFLKTHKINFEKNNRKILGKEMDIFIPELNIGIEFNGLYWHSEKFRDKFYHYNKLLDAKSKGIFLLNIWEDDWKNKRYIIESIIKNKVKINENRIYARNCLLRMLDNRDKRGFLDKSHLQGNINSSINLGLYYKDELVSLMTFGKKRMILNSGSYNINKYELLRFCNKLNTSVVGSASKLFKHFVKNYDFSEIITYSNLDISDGNLYKVLGFKEEGHTGINYWWVKNGVKYHRSNFMKHKLVKGGADPNKTENEIMKERGYFKLYGTGNIKWKFCVNN